MAHLGRNVFASKAEISGSLIGDDDTPTKEVVETSVVETSVVETNVDVNAVVTSPLPPNKKPDMNDLYPLEEVKGYATTDFHKASFNGCYDEVKALILSGVDVNEVGKEGWTALLFAGRQGYVDIVAALLDAKAKVTEFGYGSTVWNVAARYNHVEVIKLLLKRLGTEDMFSGSSALSTAASCANADLVRLIVAAVDAAQEADESGKEQDARQLDSGNEVEGGRGKSNQYSKVLQDAVLGRNAEIIELCLVRGATPGDDNSYTLLQLACCTGNMPAANLLIEYGANINGGTFQSPLHDACDAKDDSGILEMLLAKGADVSRKDNKGITALQKCAAKGRLDLARAFLEHGKRTQGSPTPTLMVLMKSERPQPFLPFLFDALTMINDESHGQNSNFVGDNMVLVPPKGLYVSCGERRGRFYVRDTCGFYVRDSRGTRLSSDVLPSHFSWSRRLNNSRSWLKSNVFPDEDSKPNPSPSSKLLRPLLYMLWKLLELILVIENAVSGLFQGKESARTARSCRTEVTLRGGLHPDFLHSLVTAADTMGSPEPLFAHDTVAALVEFHWCLYGEFAHTCSFQLFAAQLLLFTFLIAAFRDMIAAGGNSKVVGWVLQGILCGMVLYSAAGEFRAAKKIGMRHLTTAWTIMSLSGSALVLIGQILYLDLGVPNGQADIINSCAAVIMWFNLLYYLLPYEATGPLVRMILHIISDIRAFLMILFIVIIGFATAFYAIVGYTDTSNCDGITNTADYDLCVAVVQDNAPGSFSNPALALRSSFSSMFGGYDLQELDDYPSPVMLTLLWVAFMLIVSIVLLNILIAIISDSFERLIEGSKSAWLLGKAKAAIKMHTLMSKSSKAELEEYLKDKDTLYVLQPEADDNGSGVVDWNGRVSAIVSRVKESTSEIRSEVKDLAETSKAQIRTLTENTTNLAETSKQQMSDLAKDVQDIKVQLNQILAALSRPDASAH